ncbi:hypothetical protein K1719_039178 [Acacia pycnantha]|nr:hypothetical protein K1719_039178 [Acacia pycnantha]
MDHHKPTIHIAAISIPAFSHQASILQFSKRLVQLHPHLHVTCIFPTIDSPPETTIDFIQSLPSSSIHCIFLPPIAKHDLVDPQGDATPPAVQIQLAVSRSLPSLRDAIKSLCFSSPLAALITDPFANEVLELAKELHLLSFVYFPPSAMTLSLFLNLPRLDREVSGEYRDLKDPIEIIPGCSTIPINGLDLPEHLQDRTSLSYELILQRCKRFSLADGFLVNTIFEMEQSTITSLQNVFAIGPIVQSGSSSSGTGSGCLEWLEKQTPRSVLYVSFGSGGTLSEEQLNELAFGLELSGEKFLWVVRKPSESANSAYLGDKEQDSLQFLPSGFLERTKERGLVVSSWAPQSEILRHSSAGGFLTHCGWNSILESIVCGVPMMTWPLFAEQKMNAVLLTEGLKVALRLKANERGIVEKEEISKVVRSLMEETEEGDGIRRRIGELKRDAASALKQDGSSTKALSQVVDQIVTLWRQKAE